MTNGVLLFADNNQDVDYVLQAYELAKRINKYLNLPTSIVTKDKEYLLNNFNDATRVFDKIIEIDDDLISNNRVYHDGLTDKKILNFKNNKRPFAYDYSPYDNTLLMDVDYIICSDKLKNCFNQSYDFLIFKDSKYLGTDLDEKYNKEFSYVSDGGIPFYWATVVYFEKTEKNKVFFDLIKHIQANWYHYVLLYNLPRTMYRNDYAFSIAIHIMNDYGNFNLFQSMPSKIFYTLDRDILHNLENERLTFLTGKPKSTDYVLHKTDTLDVHVMNKFSLDRLYKGIKNV
jgi:hypothetical protein